MKRYFLFFVFSVTLCFGVPVLAFADDASYDRIYTVASNGSEVKKTDFDFGQKPWLFLELPSGLIYDWETTIVVWNEDGHPYTAKPSTDIFTDPLNSDNDRKIWATINNATWAEIQSDGLWTLSPVSFVVTGNDFDLVTGATNFTINSTVVPEPVSMSLFLLGSGVLALRRRRKTLK